MMLLKECAKSKGAAVYFAKQEEQEIANYLVERRFLKKSADNNPHLFQITEEGKAYAYEFIDMRLHRLLTSVISFLALIISIIALLNT